MTIPTDTRPGDQDEVDRLLAEHTEPVAVVRALDPAHCPYCQAFPDLPCAHHAPRSREDLR